MAVKEDVLILEIDKEKIDRINDPANPALMIQILMHFAMIKIYLLKPQKIKEEAYHEADFIIICVPTDFDEETSSFDTIFLKMFSMMPLQIIVMH